MKERLELKFNLTKSMSKELLKFNNLKKQLINLQNKKELEENDLKKIHELEDKLNKARNKFIKEFRDNNQAEIIKYLELKDQK